MTQNIHYQSVFTADQNINSILDAGIVEYNALHMDEERKMFFSLAYDEEVFIGGSRTFSIEEDLYIKALWVHKNYRNKGVGRMLMTLIEKEAKKRHLQKMWVDTMSYQAPIFYEKCGYVENSRVRNYRKTHDRIFFSKELKYD